MKFLSHVRRFLGAFYVEAWKCFVKIENPEIDGECNSGEFIQLSFDSETFGSMKP